MWCSQRRGDDIFLKASAYVRLQKPGSVAEKKMQVLRFAATTSFFWRLIWMLKSTVFISLSQWMPIITAEAIVSLWKLPSSAGTETFQMSWKQCKAEETFVTICGRLSWWCHNHMALSAHTKHAIQFIQSNKEEHTDPGNNAQLWFQSQTTCSHCSHCCSAHESFIICSFVSFFILNHSWPMHAFSLFKFSLVSY